MKENKKPAAVAAVALTVIMAIAAATSCTSKKNDSKAEQDTTAAPSTAASTAATSASTAGSAAETQGFSALQLQTMAPLSIEAYSVKEYTMETFTLQQITFDIPSYEVREQTIPKLHTKLQGIEGCTIDDETGAVTLDSAVLFGFDSAELSEDGKTSMKNFLDAYVEAVFTDGTKDEISKIIIEGHTDTTGTHEYNQTLSENRANNVKSYCLQIHPELNNYLEAKGYSSDFPVMKADGSVDSEASRRVVFRIQT